ncbi:MAG TPA: hypothetical protein DDW90_03090 [Cyanobacteria bacterium UBA9971]|nr:hypothetical protein [Cyanobacteria bacterium UBA9971]
MKSFLLAFIFPIENLPTYTKHLKKKIAMQDGIFMYYLHLFTMQIECIKIAQIVIPHLMRDLTIQQI